MKINVTHIAKLANVQIKEDEKEKFQKQLSEVISYVEKLKEVGTKNVETTSQVTGLENVKREDEAKSSLSQKEALSNSKSTHNGMFKVTAVLKQSS